jgi:dTDP-4-amino-4,6-dideoxygalactose transaminase
MGFLMIKKTKGSPKAAPAGAKPAQMEFRYGVRAAKVPWHTVGERFNGTDVLEVVKFLLPEGAQGSAYKAALRPAVQALSALARESSGAAKLTLGDWVKKAEQVACATLKVKHACLLNTWTAGMEVGYKLAGLRPGDEVIVPSITFVATMAYPLMIGAKVVFADVDPRTLGMDPADVARKITPRTRVIVPVHIGGYACDMDAIMKLAARHDIYVMEDAAHALGATYKGRLLGTLGHFGGYSFHEVKNINSFGEGGLLVTNLPCGEQFSKARFLGLDFTRAIPNWLYDITALQDRFGRPQVSNNHSVSEIQALGFCLQFKRLERILDTRRRNAEFLQAAFRKVPGILPPPADTASTRSSHHLYPLRIDPEIVGADIQAVRRKLKEKGVTEIPHFGPMYRFHILKQLGYNGDRIAQTCPQTEQVFNHGFTHLPLYPLTKTEVRFLAKAVIDSIQELRQAR